MTSGSHESGHEADALVSVVVAARNAAGTVEETLASLSAQSWPAWEAVVVDDGSTDATAAIVSRLAAAEGRIRLVPEGGGGVGASRSIGVEASRGEALLFLDADDWLLPDALRLLIAPLLEDTSLDGAYCGWKRVGEGGATISEWRPETEPELFPAFARYCPFAVHCCLLRRAAFERHGGFDPGLATCEDWDLWQRLTRSGARLAAVHETLAVYRTRPGSMSLADGRFIVDGLEVINRGHAPDPRVPHPHAAYRNGVDPALAPNARLQIALWGAGLAIGQGRDAAELLELVADELAPTFSPGLAADTLYWAVPVGAAQPYTAWPELWNMREERLGEALRELEGRTGAPRLAARIRALLESRILTAASGTGLRVGRMESRSIELTEPIHDLVSPSSRVLCEATVEGEPLGLVELPVCDGRIPSRVLADTLAASLGWLLLGRFLERQGHSGPDGATDGWHGFLRLLWGRDEWPLSRFYPQGQGVRHCTEGTRTSPVELSEDVRSLPLDGPAEIPLTLAGRFLGLLCVDGPVDLAPDSLVATVTEAAGFDLCIVAVREALIGRSLDNPTPLRQRLREAAATTGPRERLPR